MAVFLRREVLPKLRETSLPFPALEESLSSLVRDEWLGLFFHQKQVGCSHTVLYPHREAGYYGPALDNAVWLQIPLGGKKTRLQFHTFCLLTPGGEIVKLTLRAQSENPPLLLTGESEEKNLFLRLKMGEEKREFDLPLPRRALPLYSLTPFLSLHPLEKGKSFSLPALDLLKSLATGQWETGKIRFEVAEKDREGYLLLADYGGMTLDVRLDRGGNVLNVRTPVGWEFRKQSQAEIMAFLESNKNK